MLTLLKKPRVTEKAVSLSRQNQYVFVVAKKAVKPEVKKAIERLYKVKVIKINSVIIKGKPTRLGRIFSKKGDTKKMIVTLKEGDSLDIIPK